MIFPAGYLRRLLASIESLVDAVLAKGHPQTSNIIRDWCLPPPPLQNGVQLYRLCLHCGLNWRCISHILCHISCDSLRWTENRLQESHRSVQQPKSGKKERHIYKSLNIRQRPYCLFLSIVLWNILYSDVFVSSVVGSARILSTFIHQFAFPLGRWMAIAVYQSSTYLLSYMAVCMLRRMNYVTIQDKIRWDKIHLMATTDHLQV